jgi:hypothetical protein
VMRRTGFSGEDRAPFASGTVAIFRLEGKRHETRQSRSSGSPIDTYAGMSKQTGVRQNSPRKSRKRQRDKQTVASR